MQKLSPLISFCFPPFHDAPFDVKRRVMLVIAGTALAAASVFPVGLMLFALGSTFNALTSVLSSIPIIFTLFVLRFTQSTTIAGNYLTICVTVAVVADLGPDNGFSVLAMLALPIIATHLVGPKAGIIWTLITIAILLLLGQDMAGDIAVNGFELATTTAIMAALIGAASVIIDYTLTSESNRSVTSANRLLAQQEKLRHFLTTTFPGFLEIDNHRIVYESEGVRRLTETKLNPLENQNLSDVIHPSDYEQLREQMSSASDNGFRQELRIRDSTGQWIWLEVYAISKPNDHNWLFAVRDFANEHELRRRRENTERLQSVGLLAAGIAHDFNNLLTVIVGFSEQFPNSVEKNHVIDAAAKASELANRLVIFGKPDPGNTTHVDIAALISNWQPLLTSVLGEEIKFGCSIKTQPVWINGNESQLQQILLNIIKNAKEAMPTGGEFSLTLEVSHLPSTNAFGLAEGHYIVIELNDNGIGMEEEALNLIFDPYYSTKSIGSGRGLGLSSVYAILQQHSGGITINSASGQGTKISIALPQQSQPMATGTMNQPRLHTLPQTQTSVLVVEDEEMIRTLIKRALEDNGYQVTLASNGAQGVESFYAMNPAPAILITDVVMPEMRGSDLARKLRQSVPELLVLFVSGYSAMEIGQSDLDAQNTEFLAKPFRIMNLLDKLEKLQLSASDVSHEQLLSDLQNKTDQTLSS